ncbi:MAG: hypothetical protein ACFFEX_09835 [Candidatus Thorarchaeota archaeon]
MFRLPYSTLRREALLVSEYSLRTSLKLGGIIHFIGPAGSGKTLLAATIAADASRTSHVEWINADSKKRFIPHLKATVKHLRGVESNVSVMMTKGHKQTLDALLKLRTTITPDTSLIVIDPITRVLDMSRNDPILWGRLLIEEALPTLGALSWERGIDIIVVSEMRFLHEIGNHPVFSNEIAKWADTTIKVCRDISSKSSSVSIVENGDDRKIAQLRVLQNGACHLSLSHHRGVVTNCLEEEF